MLHKRMAEGTGENFRQFEVKTVAENRNLFLGLAFAIVAVIGWMFAADTYSQPVGTVQVGERFFNVSLHCSGNVTQPWSDRSA